jgi:hypothetical protein
MLPHKFGALTSIARFRVAIPLYFRDYFMGSEALNLLPAIPAWQMSDLNVTVKPATTAEVDSGSLIVLANGKMGVEVHQFMRETVPNNIRTIKTTYETQVEEAPATANPREIKLPSGGDYSAILLRAFDGTNTRQLENDTTGPLTWPDGYIRLYELSRQTKIETDIGRMRAEFLSNVLDTPVDGNYPLFFNRRGPGALFQTGIIGQALNNVILQAQTTSIANSSIRCVYRRVFDPENLYGIVRG